MSTSTKLMLSDSTIGSLQDLLLTWPNVGFAVNSLAKFLHKPFLIGRQLRDSCVMSSKLSTLVSYFITKPHRFFVGTLMLTGVVILMIENPLQHILFFSMPTPLVGVLRNKRLWFVRLPRLDIELWLLLCPILHGFNLSLIKLVSSLVLLHCFFVTM